MLAQLDDGRDRAAVPSLLDDGTIAAVVESPARAANGTLTLSLLLPARVDGERVAGRFLLARCGAQSPDERAAQWSIYLRRPLFATARPQPLPGEPYSLWQLAAPLQDDPGMAWLAARRAGETINLVGPYGTSFPLLPLTRRLLLVADALTGQVLRVDEIPVANVEVSIGGNATRTDANGRFMLYEVPAGRQEVYVDGSTANGKKIVLVAGDEVIRLEELGRLLDVLIAEHGDRSDRMYAADPRWSAVSDAAAGCLAAMVRSWGFR